MGNHRHELPTEAPCDKPVRSVQQLRGGEAEGAPHAVLFRDSVVVRVCPPRAAATAATAGGEAANLETVAPDDGDALAVGGERDLPLGGDGVWVGKMGVACVCGGGRGGGWMRGKQSGRRGGGRGERGGGRKRLEWRRRESRGRGEKKSVEKSGEEKGQK